MGSALGADVALCQAPDTGRTDLSQDDFYPASRTLGQDSARAGRTGGTPPSLPAPHPQPATGSAEISHRRDGFKSQRDASRASNPSLPNLVVLRSPKHWPSADGQIH